MKWTGRQLNSQNILKKDFVEVQEGSKIMLQPKFRPTPQQQDVDRVLALTSHHIQVRARAGTGKTTAMVWWVERILARQPGATIYCLAFNRSTSDELKRRMPSTVKAPTFHGMCLGMCRRRWGAEADDNNIRDLCRKHAQDYLCGNPEVNTQIEQELIQAAGLVMATRTDPTDYEAVVAMMQDYDRPLEHADMTLVALGRVLKEARSNTRRVSFDQMLDQVLVHNCAMPTADYVFVDEAQDMNRAQVEIVSRMIAQHNNSRLVVVGDEKQAIYRFRGAGKDSLQELAERFAMSVHPLSVTFRCGKAIVDAVRPLVPDYEAAESNCEGEVDLREGWELPDTLKELQPGDMVLCRTNAPLIGPLLQLVQQGTKAFINGRDIGAGLLRLCRRFAGNQPELGPLLQRLRAYASKEAQKLQGEGKHALAGALFDKLETIETLAAQCKKVYELLDLIRDVFLAATEEGKRAGKGTGNRQQAVMFSTVHKAKGLEADKVVILRPDLMPPPWVKKADNPEQALAEEANIKYVAMTRAIKTLIIQHPEDER